MELGMLKGIAVVALLVCSGSVSAQQVHKCVSGKQVSYQSDPCPGQVAKSWDATPERVDPYLEQRLESMRQTQRERAASPVRRTSARPSGVSIGVANDQSRCDQARAGRARAYEAAGVNRSFEMSRYWDNLVHDACR